MKMVIWTDTFSEEFAQICEAALIGGRDYMPACDCGSSGNSSDDRCHFFFASLQQILALRRHHCASRFRRYVREHEGSRAHARIKASRLGGPIPPEIAPRSIMVRIRFAFC